MSAAALALLAFYPLATLISPNLQFNQKNLDLKHDPSFLVIERQAQLVIAAVAVFYGETWAAVLVPQFFACFILAVASVLRQPCIARGVNKWKTSSLFISAWAAMAGLIFNLSVTGTTSADDRLLWLTLFG